MGKKATQTATKIAKEDKKQLNGLIKVLRPKVYITDSSRFKRLVQELTGNGRYVSTSSPPPSRPETLENPRPVINHVEMSQGDHQESSSLEVSTGASGNSSASSAQFCWTEEFDQVCHQIDMKEIILGDTTMNELVDSPAYGELESCLLDIQPFSFDNGFGLSVEEDINIFDYELSGLI